MFTITFITFRETLEMVLIIIPLLAYISKLDKKELSKYIYIGSLAGLIASIATGIFLFTGIKGMSGFSQNIFEGSMSFFLCALILYSIVWLDIQNKNYTASIEDKFKIQVTGVSLFLLSSLTIFRECLELILFSLPYITLNVMNIFTGISIGLFITLIVSLVIYKSSIKLNINIVFSFITLVLIYIGSIMFGEGLQSFFPQYGESIIKTGQIIFGLPLLYIFIKNSIKKYTKKK